MITVSGPGICVIFRGSSVCDCANFAARIDPGRITCLSARADILLKHRPRILNSGGWLTGFSCILPAALRYRLSLLPFGPICNFMKRYLAFFILLFSCVFAQRPVFAQSARYQAHLSVARQHGVPLLRTEDQVKSYVRKKRLTRVSSGKGYRVQRLTYSKPYLVPRAKTVLNQLAHAFYARTGSSFTVTSLTRTTGSQNRLRRVNGNAISGVSSHNYGSSFDISYVRFNGRKSSNKRLERALHAVLADFQAKGRLLYIKEYSVSCFHITAR